MAYKYFKEIDQPKFASFDDMVEIKIGNNSFNIFHNWFLAIDYDDSVHMFSTEPKFDKVLQCWLPTSSSTSVIQIGKYHGDFPFYIDKNLLDENIEMPIKASTSRDIEIRTKLTDSEIRYLTLKHAGLNEIFTLRNISEYQASNAVKQEAELRNCRFLKIKSTTRYVHSFIFKR